MKNSKTVQYLLFGIVAIVWGAIAYQVWDYLRPAGPEVSYNDRNYRPATAEFTTDTFTLSLDYPDPFTGKKRTGQKPRSASKSTKSTTTSSRRESAAPDPTPAVVIAPPKVVYQGYSINNHEITRVRLQLDGQGATYRLNEEKAGIQVIAMSKDSIIVLKQGEPFVFRRKG